MSKHPIGPWTETIDTQSASQQRGVVKYTYTAAAPVTFTGQDGFYKTGSRLARTGVNSGKRPWVSTQPASLNKNQTIIEAPGSISGEFYTSSDPTKRGFVTSTNLAPHVDNTAFGRVVTDDSLGLAKLKLIAGSNKLLQAGVFAGEFKETKETVRHVTNAMTTHHNEVAQVLGRQLSRVKRMTPTNIANVVSDAWLEWHFGMAPLIKDMHDLGTSLSVYEHGGIRKPTKLQESYSSTGTRKTATVLTVGNNVRMTTNSVTTHTLIGKCGATYVGKAPPLDNSVASVFNLTPADVVPTVYELIPYSWLLDYISNTGQVLNSLSQAKGTLADAWFVSLDEITVNSESTFEFTPSTLKKSFSSTNGRRVDTSFAFNRGVFDPNSFVLSFSAKLPNLSQAANIAALAASKLTKPLSIASSFTGRDLLHIPGLQKVTHFDYFSSVNVLKLQHKGL